MKGEVEAGNKAKECANMDTLRCFSSVNDCSFSSGVERRPLVVRRLKLNGPERERWQSFMANEGTVFGSAPWVNLQCGKRDEALFFAVEDELGICGACAVVNTRKIGNPLSGKFVIQGNPAIREGVEDRGAVVDLLFEAIDREARRRRVLAIEFEGLWSMWPDRLALERHGYQVRGLKGWIVELKGTEAEVHRKVASSFRNLKNQAQKKHNVTISESDDVAALCRLWSETYERAGKRLSPGTLAYLKGVYAALAPSKTAKIHLATRDGQALSGCFNLYFGDTIYYWHGGSVSGERFGASHLLHWSVIRDSIGIFRRYHMGGSWEIYENEELRKRAEGVSTFKRLWGAETHDFCLGGKVLRPFAHRVFTSWLLPLAQKLKSLKT
jgi:hypothetical protein